jgi:hypothetical protein
LQKENDKIDPYVLLEEVKVETCLDDDEISIPDGNISDELSIPEKTTRPVKRTSERSNKTRAKKKEDSDSFSEDEPPSKQSKKRKYKCTVENCNSSFVLKNTLEFHQAVHRGEVSTNQIYSHKPPPEFRIYFRNSLVTCVTKKWLRLRVC